MILRMMVFGKVEDMRASVHTSAPPIFISSLRSTPMIRPRSA